MELGRGGSDLGGVRGQLNEHDQNTLYLPPENWATATYNCGASAGILFLYPAHSTFLNDAASFSSSCLPRIPVYMRCIRQGLLEMTRLNKLGKRRTSRQLL